MKIQKLLWSGLSASAVLLVAGAAFSGGASTSVNQLVDYNQATGELSAYPVGQGLATYLHQPNTVHLLADLTRFTPPDPCRGLSEAWNATVQYDTRHNVNSRFIFDALLVVMSDFQCRATVTATTGTPQPILVITPTAK